MILPVCAPELSARQSRNHTLGGSNEPVRRWTPVTPEIRCPRGGGGRPVDRHPFRARVR